MLDVDLARDALLERLAKLEEAGERGVASGGPNALPAEQAPLARAVDDEDDHGCVDARPEARAASAAAPALAIPVEFDGVRAASAAELH